MICKPAKITGFYWTGGKMGELLYKVPDVKKVRVIVHTDCKNEADDQFALAHALMTPKLIVKGIVAGHFDRHPQEWGSGHTTEASFNEVHKVLKLMRLDETYGDKVYAGAATALEDELTPIPSDGARFIIEEALRDDPRPLFILLQGAVTDLASAILMEPRITKRMTAVWVGGGTYPEGGFEFNLWNDVRAANIVFRSEMPLWQIPIDVYKQMAVTLAELQVRVRPCGEIGRYLFEQMVAYNISHIEELEWPHGETWGLGDQTVIAVLMEEIEAVNYEMIQAPVVCDSETMRYDFSEKNRSIRVYKKVDSRVTMEDFYAKLMILYGS